MLTAMQKHQFETFGFLLLKNLIPLNEMQPFIDGFDETMAKSNGGPWEHAPSNQGVTPFYRHNPELYHRLLDHEKVNETVKDLLGPGYSFGVSEGHHRYKQTTWHHDDVAPDELTHIKFSYFLDSVRSDTGCLQVLPGTHFPEVRKHMENWYDFHVKRDTCPWPSAVALESDPGDAVIFNLKTYHAAFGKKIDRRVIYTSYIQKPSTQKAEDYMIHLYKRDSSQLGCPYYTPDLFENATPARLKMLSFFKKHCYDPAISE